MSKSSPPSTSSSTCPGTARASSNKEDSNNQAIDAKDYQLYKKLREDIEKKLKDTKGVNNKPSKSRKQGKRL
ncbi:MAG: hypothetical protein ACKPA7_25210 [Sphaerospermopsis kisseleviana]